MSQPATTVLVVDDEANVRQLLRLFLQRLGHTVVAAEDGDVALSMVREHPVDLVLLDILMPGISGMEVLRQLKASPATVEIPVVIVSSESDIESIAASIKLGAEDYLPKPFNPVILAARVGACLERRQLRAREQAYQAQLESRIAERTSDLIASEGALRRQSTILSSILASMGDGVVVVDRDGSLIHENPAARAILGGSFAAMLPADSAQEQPFFYGDQATRWRPEDLPLALALRGQEVDGLELYLRGAEPQGQWLSVTARPIREEGAEVAGAVAVIRDISAAKRSELALRESEQRYALAARGANDGLWDWDLRAGRIYLSPRWKAMLGYGEEEIGDSPDEWLGRVHPDDQEPLEAHLVAHYRQLITHFEHEYRIRHRDGSYRWMLCRGLAVWDREGQAERIAGSQTDISDRKQAEQRLIYDALHDGLTGLPNRALFLDRLKHALARVRRNPDYRFAVIFLDLDRFKVINDSLGHTVGDQLLEAVAQRLEECVRPGDTVARLGGDEFTMLLEDTADDEQALAVAERVQQRLATPIWLNDQEVFTAASIGIAMGGSGYDTASDLIRDADTAMYHAKISGKARAMLFDPAMHAAVMQQLQIESALRWAVEREELRVHYQPIVALESGRIVGLETLLRWQHAQRGLLYPADFLAVAEETGLIVPIGWWVLREACQQLRLWQERLPAAESLWVTVNLSARQLAQPDVVAQVFGALAQAGLMARHLKLEVTETTLIEFGGRSGDSLQQLRAAGVQVCMDDFGTGYSSLSYLQRLPVDVLKIDRSFISQIGTDERRAEIVQTILSLAKALGLQAVAEGTETARQAELLRALNCELGQGWLFSKALEPGAIEALLAANTALPPSQ